MNLTARNVPKIPAIICRIKRFTIYTLAKYDYLGKDFQTIEIFFNLEYN